MVNQCFNELIGLRSLLPWLVIRIKVLILWLIVDLWMGRIYISSFLLVLTVLRGHVQQCLPGWSRKFGKKRTGVKSFSQLTLSSLDVPPESPRMDRQCCPCKLPRAFEIGQWSSHVGSTPGKSQIPRSRNTLWPIIIRTRLKCTKSILDPNFED